MRERTRTAGVASQRSSRIAVAAAVALVAALALTVALDERAATRDLNRRFALVKSAPVPSSARLVESEKRGEDWCSIKPGCRYSYVSATWRLEATPLDQDPCSVAAAFAAKWELANPGENETCGVYGEKAGIRVAVSALECYDGAMCLKVES